MRVLLAISLLALMALLWVCVAMAHHVRRARRRSRRLAAVEAETARGLGMLQLSAVPAMGEAPAMVFVEPPMAAGAFRPVEIAAGPLEPVPTATASATGERVEIFETPAPQGNSEPVIPPFKAVTQAPEVVSHIGAPADVPAAPVELAPAPALEAAPVEDATSFVETTFAETAPLPAMRSAVEPPAAVPPAERAQELRPVELRPAEPRPVPPPTPVRPVLAPAPKPADAFPGFAAARTVPARAEAFVLAPAPVEKPIPAVAAAAKAAVPEPSPESDTFPGFYNLKPKPADEFPGFRSPAHARVSSNFAGRPMERRDWEHFNKDFGDLTDPYQPVRPPRRDISSRERAVAKAISGAGIPAASAENNKDA
jgi:hypothetical protein